ncbi:hypothetical protein H4S06_005182 [Coemansia sp. BCRC 34490]|nr:hypothetical protein H4S06_005182 [Coemansia sp. BCRC 34490]
MMMRQYRIKQTATTPPPSSPGLSIARTANNQYRRRPAEPPLADARNSKRRRTADTKGIGIGIAGGASATTTTTGDGGGGSSRGISISGTAPHKQPERKPAHHHDHQGARKRAPAKHGDVSEDATNNIGVGRRRSVFGYQMQQALWSRMRDTNAPAGTPRRNSSSSSSSSGHDAGSRRNQPGAGIAIAKTAKKDPPQ